MKFFTLLLWNSAVFVNVELCKLGRAAVIVALSPGFPVLEVEPTQGH